MKGYKVFNEDWTCRGFQYKVGEVYEMEKSPKCCIVGFHFCKKLKDCFNYYKFDPKNKVAIVEVLGDIDREKNGSKACTNKMKIIEELTWNKVLDLVNTGDCNTGNCNTGNRNTGNRNTGDYNTGDCNTGDCNTGDCNTGNRNTGDYNTGYWNTGNRNTGNRNTGDYNTGDYNIGYCNTGNRNTGDYNTGFCNTGDCNTGDCNTGNRNTGDYNTGFWNAGNCNTGDYNTGYYNTGHWNTGDWNTGNRNIGCFNTKTPKMHMFNRETNITYEDWEWSRVKSILEKMPTDNLIWVCDSEMTDKEKENNPTYKTTGGYLKTIRVTDKEKQEWYNSLKEEDKKEIQNMPNFDAEIFKEIIGIDVTEIRGE